MKNIRFLSLLLCLMILTQSVWAADWSMKEGRLMTEWAADVDPAAPLPEYPRPQMVRDQWLNLNGIWEYQPGVAEDAVPVGQTLSSAILVPFPVESAISGVMEHHDRLWYRRSFEIPAEWAGQNVLINFGSVDWESEVYINGNSLGIHKGCNDSFSYDITPYLTGQGPQELIVRVFDPTNSQAISCGKQDLYPNGIWYTAVTGIWQTVWLEPVPQTSIKELKLTPDIDNDMLKVTGFVSEMAPNLTVKVTAYDKGVAVGNVSGAADQELHLIMQNPKLWSPDSPFLYDLVIELWQGNQLLDTVDSYFGMRKISLKMVDGINRLALNNEFIFQYGPLDQGWWPDGLYTAPTDEALRWDLEMTKAFGFNMSRKHVKVEPARWYYWADKLGLLVWQDMPSARNVGSSSEKKQFEHELEEMIREFHNYPSIVYWTVFNEGWGQYDTVRLTKKAMELDPSRIVACASGWNDYEVGHIIDFHSYPPPNSPTPTEARAAVCGEYGGIGMWVEGHMWADDSWGYGGLVSGPEELVSRYDSYADMVRQMKDNPGMSAAVYTQLTDVEIEANGLITYDRKVIKADMEAISRSNSLYARTYEIVLPTAVEQTQDWKYVLDAPAGDWFNVSYDDSSWMQGSGGFGTSETPGSTVGTVWNTENIWLRKEFQIGDLSPEDIENLIINTFHDEDVEIYLNGVLASSIGGYTTSYIKLTVAQAAKDAIVTNGTNTIAIHCLQTRGGQFIDAGLGIETIIVEPKDPCGEWGYAPGDLNEDCVVDLEDVAVLALEWLKTGKFLSDLPLL